MKYLPLLWAALWRRKARTIFTLLSIVVAFLLFANGFFNEAPTVYKVRNFFGVLNVTDTSDGKYHVLWHGTTAQGTQQVNDDQGNPLSGRPEMIADWRGRRSAAPAPTGVGTARCRSAARRRGSATG